MIAVPDFVAKPIDKISPRDGDVRSLTSDEKIVFDTWINSIPQCLNMTDTSK